MIGYDLVNEGKYSFIHIKSGEVRSGYTNVKQLVNDIIFMFKVFNEKDGLNEYSFYDIQEEFCIVAPLSVIDSAITELESELNN